MEHQNENNDPMEMNSNLVNPTAASLAVTKSFLKVLSYCTFIKTWSRRLSIISLA